ncbi:alpha/beta hydrolase [Pantoea sp. Tr-811]|uniref:alpha/beta hydrolase n=1 Tax=Pantoea sp. Tr-811 TaxID=2608361 RepID=UPI00141E29F7|nr:alpha/beta hydrolase [Pantoea sp. Tr-811]NIF24762.1 alpha/beta hydrolase [Pantoea sp. Tr-811]
MKRYFFAILLSFLSWAALAQDMSRGANNFYKSNDVDVEKVAFNNQYGMKIVANLYRPKSVSKSTRLAAIVVGHPNGAVKEQSANLYAQKMAEQGFVTLAPDLSFWGESEGARNAVSSDIYTEVFMASVDFLGTRPYVDRANIGALGICGSGGYVISAAKIDPRIKAIATVSMYDMGEVNRTGLQHSQTLEQRRQFIAQAAEQRYVEFLGGAKKYSDGMLEKLRPNASAIEKEFFDFYRTPRGEFVPSGQTLYLTTNRPITAEVKQMNFYPFNDIETISPRPVLFIAGESAHSREFSETAYKLAGEPKELFIVPNAGHVDLYDRTDVIPFSKLSSFFRENLN